MSLPLGANKGSTVDGEATPATSTAHTAGATPAHARLAPSATRRMRPPRPPDHLTAPTGTGHHPPGMNRTASRTPQSGMSGAGPRSRWGRRGQVQEVRSYTCASVASVGTPGELQPPRALAVHHRRRRFRRGDPVDLGRTSGEHETSIATPSSPPGQRGDLRTHPGRTGLGYRTPAEVAATWQDPDVLHTPAN
jgi:hypothetical protein